MAGYQIDEGGFAGAVRADQRHAVTLAQRQRDIARDVQPAEGLLQMIDLEECSSFAASPVSFDEGRGRAIKALGRKQHHGNQQCADDRQPMERVGGRDQIFDPDKSYRADQRSVERAHCRPEPA